MNIDYILALSLTLPHRPTAIIIVCISIFLLLTNLWAYVDSILPILSSCLLTPRLVREDLTL